MRRVRFHCAAHRFRNRLDLSQLCLGLLLACVGRFVVGFQLHGCSIGLRCLHLRLFQLLQQLALLGKGRHFNQDRERNLLRARFGNPHQLVEDFLL